MPGKTTGSAGMNIQGLLSTLNDKLGVVYDNAKNVNDNAKKQQAEPTVTQHQQQQQQAALVPELSTTSNKVYEQPIPGLSAGATQR